MPVTAIAMARSVRNQAAHHPGDGASAAGRTVRMRSHLRQQNPDVAHTCFLTASTVVAALGQGRRYRTQQRGHGTVRHVEGGEEDVGGRRPVTATRVRVPDGAFDDILGRREGNPCLSGQTVVRR